jgi:predicted alpha-1,2-mannosidase
VAGLALAGLLATGSPAAADPTPAAPAADVASLVDPMAGTAVGGTFPGADTPFGMVQYSPNTDGGHGGGYDYNSPTTWGFATTHLSGPGCAAMGDVVSLPTVGPVSTVDAERQKTTFSHASEDASPGYYSVLLDASQVRAELTATTHTGWARYGYPSNRKANVIIDPGADFRGARAADVEIVGNDTVEGSVSTWGFWNACPARGPNQYTVHFSMKFDRPFKAFGTGNGARLHRSTRAASGKDAGAYLVFDASSDRRPVVSKVGISFVDLQGARRNLAAEGGSGFDFDGVQAAARGAWDGVLGRVEVAGGSTEQQRTFYSSLYHTLLHPNVSSDVDGRYQGFDGRVHVARQAHYTNFSMWDTYRSAHEVIDLVDPQRVGAMMRSLIADWREGGWLPKWPYASYYTNEMVGDPAANVIADAYLKGLVRRGDVANAYAALIHNATALPDPGPAAFEGRTGLEEYINDGYVPYHGGGDYPFSGTINVEYAVNDCALALMAGRLGQKADAAYLLRRSKRYRKTVDRSTGFVRPRLASGAWLSPFDPEGSRGFKEGSAWQYTWLAPHDTHGLIATLGGRDNALAKLDQFFAYDKIAADPTAAHALWHGRALYNPRNEGDLQAPYLYSYLGQPWKTEDVVHGAETFYSSAPNGLPSSDDLGATSAWFVLAALGLYPATAGDDHYALTSPLFPHIVVHQGSPDHPIVIDAPGAPGVFYVQDASLDGKPVATSVVSHEDLAHGAHLAFSVGSARDRDWATGPNTAASACVANPATPDVRLHVRRAPGRAVRVTLHNSGDARASGVRVYLQPPRGWSARAQSRTPGTLDPNRTATQNWKLRPPHRRRFGRLRAYATWSGPAGSGAALRTFATGSVG